MSRKPISFSIFMSLAMLLLGAASGRASETQIATLDIVTTMKSPGVFTEIVTISNLTSTTLNFQTFRESFPPNPPFGPFPFNVSIGPNSTNNQFGCSGGCNDGISFSLSGVLAGLDFSIGGQNFEASTLGFTTPTFRGDFNGSLPLEIDATLLTSTPEPASVLLFGTGLLGIMLMFRKGLLV